jgi:hypothetical protein
MPISSLNSVNKTTGSGNFINAVGGTITSFTSGGATYRVHTYTGSGSFDIEFGSGYVDYLIVAGGGAGGGNGHVGGGGGGAGGYLEGSFKMVAGSYPVVVGAGGVCPPGQKGGNGQNSTFYTLVAYGGGGGANHQDVDVLGSPGGSGGEVIIMVIMGDLEYMDKETKGGVDLLVLIILVLVVVVQELWEALTQNIMVEQQMVLVVQEKQLL